MEDEKPTAFSDFKETPLWNETIPMEERLNYLIQELTLEEKILCISVRAPEVKRLGIKSFMLGGEIAHGVEARHDQEFNKGIPVKTTGFTQPIGLSATWDIEIMEKIGVVVGTEARAVYNLEGDIGLSRWGPTVDMERDPRWGRTEEGYGEDPYLTGVLTTALIHGIQGRDDFYLRCAVTLKHFYGNNEEKDRTYSSASMDSRNKQEYYLEPFKRAIIDGKAEGIMTSYNEINGIPAIINPEVKELVKDTWGLSGHVVCDMGDMGHTVSEHKYFDSDAQTLSMALKCGVDSFNDPDEKVIAAAVEALEKGYITEEEINQALRNTFTTKIRFGIYDKGNACPYPSIDMGQVNCREHQNICLEAADKAIVLLKNEEGLLPLKKYRKENLAVIGPLADEWNMDWYSGLPYKKVTPLEGIKTEFPDADITFSDGIDRVKIQINDKYVGVKEDGTCYLADAAGAEVFEHMDWGDNKHTLRAVSTKKYLRADMEAGGLLANQEKVFSWFVQEVFTFHNLYGDSLKNTEFCDTETFNIKSWNQLDLYAGDKESLYFREQIEEVETPAVCSFQIVTEGRKEAVKIAKTADTVIAVMGCHPIINCKEGTDRENINFPPMQRKLLESLKNANPRIILVLVTNYPYLIDWEKETLPAILMSATGSQELGSSIARVIAGTYSPAGRLSMTWYLNNEQLPPMRNYDIIQGKRTYQYFDGKVLYPFGYGLSYTNFLYYGLKINKAGSSLNISFSIKNTGEIDSDEVVQLYVSQLSSRAIRPSKQLKGFKRIFIKAGEEKELTFSLPLKELEYFDVVTGAMVLEESDYLLQVGASSEDIRLEEKIQVEGQVIPSRDMSKWIPCDHYDGYENMILHRGHGGKPCILPMILSSVNASSENANGLYNDIINLKAENSFRDKANDLSAKEGSLSEGGKIFYKDVSFTFAPSFFLVDVKAEEKGIILLRLGSRELVHLEVEASEDFHILKVPVINHLVGIGEKQTLEIEILGRIRMVTFSFQ